jgi:hypothetical protein
MIGKMFEAFERHKRSRSSANTNYTFFVILHLCVIPDLIGDLPFFKKPKSFPAFAGMTRKPSLR